MNLADAIRQAALNSGTSLTDPAPRPAEAIAMPKNTPEPVQKASAPAAPAVPADSIETAEAASGSNGNFVRLELFLAPEQLSALLSAVVKTQHSVLTLREAAGFLRLPVAVVEQMANDKRLPAFSIDGRWRFSHQALEEWTNTHKADFDNQETAL